METTSGTPTTEDLARDLAADLAWVTSDEVCIHPRILQVAGAGLRRAIAAEAKVRSLRTGIAQLRDEVAELRTEVDNLRDER